MNEQEKLQAEYQEALTRTLKSPTFEEWLKTRLLYEQAVRTFVTTPVILPKRPADGSKSPHLYTEGNGLA